MKRILHDVKKKNEQIGKHETKLKIKVSQENNVDNFLKEKSSLTHTSSIKIKS